MTESETPSNPRRYSEATLIPKSRYTSREFADLEFEKLWPKVWQIACREEELPNPGDFVEYRIGDQSIVVVRDEEGKIRAFHNACLHRGTQLCSETGNMAEFKCRFHGWRWNLAGEIREVPDGGDFAAELVSRANLMLPRVLADTWGGFVWVNMDLEAEPLLEFLDPMPSVVARYEPEKMRFLRRRSTIMPCNWKVALDAFNEAYHLAATHIEDVGGIRGGKPMEGFLTRPEERNKRGATAGSFGIVYTLYDRHSIYSSSEAVVDALMNRPISALGDDPKASLLGHLRNQVTQAFAHESEVAFVEAMTEISGDETVGGFLNRVRRETAALHGADYSHLTDYDMLRNLVTHYFPNITGVILAGNWIFFRFRPNGRDPDSSIFDVYFLHRFGDGEEPPAPEEFYADWRDHEDWGITLLQDFNNMAFVQRGLRQNNDEDIRLGRQEQNIRNMHRVLETYVYPKESASSDE